MMFGGASAPRHSHIETLGVVSNCVIDERTTIGVGRSRLRMADLGRDQLDHGCVVRHRVILGPSREHRLGQRAFTVDRDGDRKCLRLMKIGLISGERPDATERSRPSWHLLSATNCPVRTDVSSQSRCRNSGKNVLPVPETSKIVLTNRWQYAVNTAITYMSTNVVSLASRSIRAAQYPAHAVTKKGMP